MRTACGGRAERVTAVHKHTPHPLDTNRKTQVKCTKVRLMLLMMMVVMVTGEGEERRMRTSDEWNRRVTGPWTGW
jgi:hypothetical protein